MHRLYPPTVLGQFQPLYRALQKLHTGIFGTAHQGVYNIRCVIRYREYPLPSLNLSGHAQVLHQSDGVIRHKVRKGGIQEPWVGGNMLQQPLQVKGSIGHIAAPFAGDAQFAPGALHFFNQQHTAAPLGTHRCGGQPGSTDADDNFWFTHTFSSPAASSSLAFSHRAYRSSLRAVAASSLAVRSISA